MEPVAQTRAIFPAMSIPVLLFASYADAFGARQVDAPLDAPCSVRDLVASMRALPAPAAKMDAGYLG